MEKPEEPEDMLMNYNDYLTYIDKLEEPLPVSGRTIRIYLDALTETIAQTDLILHEARTMQGLLQGIEKSLKDRTDLLTAHLDRRELKKLHDYVIYSTTVYHHQHAQNAGIPLPKCTLSKPCPYHPTP